MNLRKTILIIIFAILSQVMPAQPYNGFLDSYHFNKSFQNQPVKNADAYQDIEGNPFLKKEFTDGMIKINDTLAFKLPLRYNLYTDEMEYQLNGVVYAVGEPQLLKKIVLGESVFIYVPFIGKGGFVELLASGKCILVQKRSVRFKPAEGPKPIEGTSKSAEFISEPDIFYIGAGDSKTVKITNINSVVRVLQDQSTKVENFIRMEKIKKATKENLIKIATYYNTL